MQRCVLCKLLCFFLIVGSVGQLEGIEKKKSLILRSREAGFFSIFYDVIALLKIYEKGKCASAEVDFGTGGYYYDSRQGSNWWEYYFEPIALGQKNKTRVVEVYGDDVMGYKIEFYMSRQAASRLMEKYIKIKSDIQKEIDRFTETHFQNFYVIGVHYRGTDKCGEAPKVPYEEVFESVLKEIDQLEDDRFKIFVATDEADFLDYMHACFGDKMCYYEEGDRSMNGMPLHIDAAGSQYKRGRDALIDCVLLSRADLLLRTSSNLSKVATYFNPKLKVIELSQRYLKKPPPIGRLKKKS